MPTQDADHDKTIAELRELFESLRELRRMFPARPVERSAFGGELYR